MRDLKQLMIDLPEDVLKRKWAGDLEGELLLIDRLLQGKLPACLRERLLIERDAIPQLEKEFRFDRAEALALLKTRVPDFSDEELEELELRRAVEYIYVHGEKHYHEDFLDTLLKVDVDYAARAGEPIEAARPDLDTVIEEIKRDGEVSFRIGLQGELRLSEDAFRRNASIRVALPIPQRCAQQSDIKLIDAFGTIADEDSAQRTVVFERMATENEPFRVEYAYTARIRYVEPLSGRVPDGHIYPAASEPTTDDLSEQLPHIAFTPLLCSLAKEIIGDEQDPMHRARRIYDYVTTCIRYSYMRSYALIERHAEFCVLNGKGDCGIQAILFITLCRIVGIPARWQSGLMVRETDAGCHDWAQFYVEPYGWLFADPSFGGSAYRSGAEERWNFYFGNLDPYRMVANSRYQTPLANAEDMDRFDPYDNQRGEVEIDSKRPPKEAYHTEYKTTVRKRLK